MCFFLDLLVLTCNISIETCAYVLLSWYALRGEALRPPPCTPPPAFIFKPVPLATYYSFLFTEASSFIWVNFIFVDIHRDLCLCVSFLIFSFLLAIYPLRLVPMCFSLGTHCGGRRCAPPPCTPPPAFIFKPVPLATYYSFLFA